MKRLLLLGLGLAASVTAVQAQRTEFSGHATSGYYRYRGESATGTTYIVGGQPQTPAVFYVVNPYGNRFTLSYGGALQVQRVTARRWVLGGQAGYEWLRSRASVSYLSTPRFSEQVLSHVIQTNRFINTHMFGGKRFEAGVWQIDVTAGPEVGVLLESRSRATASAAGTTAQVDDKLLKFIDLDVRARLNVTAYYQRFGLSAGYSHGLTNNLPDYNNFLVDRNLKSQMVRLGVAYRLN